MRITITKLDLNGFDSRDNPIGMNNVGGLRVGGGEMVANSERAIIDACDD